MRLPDRLLDARFLCAGYGGGLVLDRLSLHVGRGEVVGLLGRNGAGRSTLIKAVLGGVAISGGSIAFAGRDITGWRPDRVARLGLGWVPEGRRIFASLDVEENLLVSARAGVGESWTLERVYALFPRLAERRRQLGPLLSGGEQQMLAIARALMTNPTLLLLDEATEGLAPRVRAEIWQTLGRLKQAGLAILVVDKNVAALQRLAERLVILDKGRAVWSGTGAELDRAPGLIAQHLALAVADETEATRERRRAGGAG
jgi:branched-chain amino acid transport system ATP-binding protein